jgi:hypothetical protein
VELAVRAFERLLNAFDLFNDLHLAEEVDVDAGGVAHQSENGLMDTFGLVEGNALLFQPGGQTVKLSCFRIFFQNYDHFIFPLCYIENLNKKRPAVFAGLKDIVEEIFQSGQQRAFGPRSKVKRKVEAAEKVVVQITHKNLVLL